MSLVAFKTLPKEVLSEYDMILCIDRSGSMGFPSNNPSFKGSSRWKEAEEMVRSFAEFADAVDDDGITVITFGGTIKTVDGVKADVVHDIFNTQSPSGGTPLAEALQQAIAKFKQSSKRAFVITVTDGEPNSKQDVINTIIKCGNDLENGNEITFLFVQIGEDPNARRFLIDLDDNLTKAGAKHDIVDCITHDEANKMTFEEMLSKALVD